MFSRVHAAKRSLTAFSQFAAMTFSFESLSRRPIL
jgi:hypothetical protein